jgi:hypothetical protein
MASKIIVQVTPGQRFAFRRVARAREVTVSEAVRQLVNEEDERLRGSPGIVRGEAAGSNRTRRES